MGCYNGTCGISNLPIHAGNPIYLLLMISNGDWTQSIAGQAYYPDDLYKPIGFPIEGEYDDYGGIENVKQNQLNEHFFRDQFKYFRRNNDGEYEPYCWESFELFLSDLTEDDLFVEVMDWDFSNASRDVAPVKVPKMAIISYMMVHKSLYDRLIESVGNRIPYDKTEPVATLYKKQVEKQLQKYERENELAKLCGYENVLFTFTTTYSSLFDKSYDYFADVYIQTKDEAILNSLRDFILWKFAMSYMRKGYHCYTGLGSQCSDYELHKIVAEFILETYENRVAQERTVEETVLFFDK